MRALLPEILAFADIGEFVDQPVKTYSSGMALRLAFAVATAVAPRILIVDEALAVGDEAFQRKCFARIEKIRDDGAAILFVSHSPQQILELCDVAMLLDGGEMLLMTSRGAWSPSTSACSTRRRMRSRVCGRQRAARRAAQAAAPSARGRRRGEAAPGAPAQASLDPSLRSASVVEYAAHGARIGVPRITTPDGAAVNVLVRGDRYVVRYDVDVRGDGAPRALRHDDQDDDGRRAGRRHLSPVGALGRRSRRARACGSRSSSRAASSPACTSSTSG